MLNAESYENDRALAREKGDRFHVARKEGRGMPWRDIAEDIVDLHDAMTLADATQCYETGVFMDGFLYWTSAHPDVFNSTVLMLRIDRRD
jgi:hypothetical protein